MDKLQYPYERDWNFKSINMDQYESLTTNWNNSKELIEKIREKLTNLPKNSNIKTIAAAGSLGRMEACNDTSDADLIIVLSDDIKLNTETVNKEAQEAYDQVWQCLNDIQLDKPKSDGVFSTPTNKTELLNLIGDAKKENYKVFAKRLLLLLETQLIYNNEEYDNLLSSIIDKYAEGYIKEDSKKEWTFLLNDLIRYFRSIAVNYQWSFENDPVKWRIRNIKLRHSRLVMYGGLLMLLGEASKERQDKINWLKTHLTKTPLERIAWVYEQNKDYNFQRIAGFYNVFLSYLNKPEVREKLKDNSSSNINTNGQVNSSYQERYKDPDFSHLKANSDGLISEFIRFIFDRRGAWTERFFEYLIF